MSKLKRRSRNLIQVTMKNLDNVVTLVTQKILSQDSPLAHSSIDAAMVKPLVLSFFARAPHNFLEEVPDSQLASISVDAITLTSTLYTQLQSFKEDPGSIQSLIHVKVITDPDGAALLIAIPDRPFIVNTLSECFTRLNLTPVAFLHPILTIQNQRFSCSYITFESLPDTALKNACSLIQASLSDLLIITSDYSAIQQEIRVLAENLLDGLEEQHDIDYETPQFLDWLSDDNFVFLGLRKFHFQKNGDAKSDISLGFFRTQRDYLQTVIDDTNLDGTHLLEKNIPILVSRLRTESPIHRMVRMVNITIRAYNKKSAENTLYAISGLLTSKARAQESFGVPLIRKKLQKIIEQEDVVFNSHDYKYLVDIMDSMPKDEAFRLDLESLRENIHFILEMQHINDIRLLFRYDDARRGASLLVVMPREKFNSQVRQQIQRRLEELFGSIRGSSEYHLNYTNKPLIRFYFYIPLPEKPTTTPSLKQLQKEISDIVRTWNDNLIERFYEKFSEEECVRLIRTYGNSFTSEYQVLYSPNDAITDIIECEKITAEKPIHVALFDLPDQENPNYTLTVYSSDRQITVSQALPVLDNLGLDVINETSSLLETTTGRIYIHRFSFLIKSHIHLEKEHFDEFVAPALEGIFLGAYESDSLNSLIIDAQLAIRSTSLLRVYCALLWQITKFASRQAIFDSLTTYPNITKHIWEMFKLRFDPEIPLTLSERGEHYDLHLNVFKDELRQVTDITKDRILRGIASLLSASVRTNFFQDSDRIAIKFRSREIDIMPNPRPLFEIFIRSNLTEGVHLRNGSVSRGGIRWSDRVEDYRSEVLGLMATQTMKNVLIVPDGAKGGFIVRQMPKAQNEVFPAVQNAYRDFIRGILSLSDNREGDKIIKPAKVVCWDPDDPYLVVAADKGTATFSDTANEIAVKEFSFWLDDAFASGGSFGYDHKKYAITAKGAWESARRHFFDMKIDFEQQPFTAIGVGDMSGDVFGNGLLLSKTIRLVAAFDHRHVFIDPSPDASQSYIERKRLFDLPRSSWADYNRSLISTGGGVYGRYDKEIIPSKEARQALGIDSSVPEVMSGEELISFILKAPVDLFFNGGIGTYVKAANQSHADVNDGTNDRVRIDALDLRAQIVVEGGNLGFTQRARVEYAENGGRINTDAIDNSAGVDLSDHEVNLKILFGELMRTGKLTRTERDRLMLDIATEVTDLVLADNRIHALLLSIAVSRSRRNITYFHSFINRMVKLGIVSRHRDSLPDDDALNERAARKMGLVRPELAICLAAGKRWLKNCLHETKLLTHPLLQRHLVEYFPKTLQTKFGDTILNHPLSGNIVATQVTNYLINATGVTFLHRMCVKHSVNPEVAITCTLAADIIMSSNDVHKTLWLFDRAENSDDFIKWWTTNGDAIREASSWLIRNHGSTHSLQQIIDLYQLRFQTLVNHAEDIFTGDDKERYESRLQEITSQGLPIDVARRLALFPEIVRILEMLWSSMQSHHSIPVVTTIYGQILESLDMVKLLQHEGRIDTATKWESELLSHSYDEIRHSISLLTVKLLNQNITQTQAITQAIKRSPNYEQMAATLAETEGTIPSVTALAVIARQLSAFNPALF